MEIALTVQLRHRWTRKVVSTFDNLDAAYDALAALCPEEMRTSFSVGDDKLSLRDKIYRLENLKPSDITTGWTLSQPKRINQKK